MSRSGEQEERLRKAAQYRAAQGGAAEPGDALAELERQNDGDDRVNGLAPLRPGEDEAERARLIVDRAVARGDFDTLALAGKPIPGLGEAHDPDWWVKGLIQRENITGLGPQAILLRKEDAELDARLDRQYTPAQVREILEDFNYRVIDARRQLLGGPPVITRLRDVDVELERWRERREAARRAAEAAAPPVPARIPLWRRLLRGSG
ncbi:DnaJ family domain-containing protein [uncultured Arthrobacter sp.]|uniref:DnaJ family domain-containing protein n=1 Tax=uncultured Arthrobacter sp. TaxID=114050 RepID=UPI0026101ADC|nr:DnaJ family domain-containing protein [uncultured Arthrobacter sp.]